ncbi:SsgA family sporulation/cell division regulator [Streptomyces sp. NPDC060194]|uniref:SsgA family sporulation/cell division regulator n=1 Tax=Streptomyces sp. NPDC060194 TaxID=3347069 RepID=UPI003660E89A
MKPAAPAVEDHTRAHLVSDTGAHAASSDHRPVPVALRHDPAADPGALTFAFPDTFPGGSEWSFPRDLLEAGMRSPAEGGGIRVWPCGRVQTVVEFHSAHAVAVVQFDNAPLIRFLRRTHAVAVRTAPVRRSSERAAAPALRTPSA